MNNYKKFKSIVALSLFAISFLGGCSSSSNSGDGDKNETDDDSDSLILTDSNSDSSTYGYSDSDSNLIETPPELPVKCEIISRNQQLSGMGDGKNLSIDFDGTDVFGAWTYVTSQETLPHIETGMFQSETGSFDIQSYLSGSVIAEDTFLTASDGKFALVWLDGRTDWDPDCLSSNVDKCIKDVAFMTFKGGFPEASAPLRITENRDNIIGRPKAASIDNSFIVVWRESGSLGGTTVFLSIVDSDLNVGKPVKISDDDHGDTFDNLILSASSESILVMWSTLHNYEIEFRLLNPDGTIKSEIKKIDTASQYFYPSSAADDNGYLVSWSRKLVNDYEIFTQRIDEDGNLEGEENRITFTDSDIYESKLSFSSHDGLMITWLSSKENGSTTCIDSSCSKKAFAAPLNIDGTLQASPLFIGPGTDYLASSENLSLSFAKDRWITGYESFRNFRTQLAYSTFVCK
ncbi:MAG: hypothetical protein JXR91_14180 [Deltaproteobacteria bacterium]|nr:hypothetical protein [Deltaproteobacteria bacterium]